MKRIIALGLVAFLSACTSPTFDMPPAQIASLTDDQLCKFQNGYRDEAKLEAEISKRNINCDRFYRECLSQGNKPGTQAMNFCIAVLRDNERLRYEDDRFWGGGVGVYNSFPRHHRH